MHDKKLKFNCMVFDKTLIISCILIISDKMLTLTSNFDYVDAQNHTAFFGGVPRFF